MLIHTSKCAKFVNIILKFNYTNHILDRDRLKNKRSALNFNRKKYLSISTANY